MKIWDIVLGFMDSQVVLTADEIGLFDVLDRGPKSLPEIARETQLPEDSAKRLMTMLCAMEMVKRREDGRYENTPTVSEELVRGKPGYIGEMFRHVREDLYPVWRYFKETLYEQKPQWERAFPGRSTASNHLDPEALRAFMEGMHTITYEAAEEFAANAPELERVRHLIDIGGASGAFLIALAEKFPQLRGTVLDLPMVKPIAEDFVRNARLQDRLSFHGADFFHDPLPNTADAYSLGFILHDWDTESGNHLLSAAARNLPTGGLLIISEFLLEDDRTGPAYVARSDLNMLVAAKGRERTAREYAEWIGQFGFTLRRIQPTKKGKYFLIAEKTGSTENAVS